MGVGPGVGVGVGNKISVGVCVYGLVFVVVLARLYFLRTVSLSSLFNGALIKRACCWLLERTETACPWLDGVG